MSDIRQRWFTVAVLCTAQAMLILDENIVNVALPSIRSDLNIATEDLVWTVNAYVVPFAGFLLLAGRLGDLLGRRGVFLCGLAVFTVASLACGLADDQATLLTARFVQGTGGALASAGLLGMIALVFDDADRRNKAIGAFGFASSGGSAIGLVAGGVLTSWLSWHWIFLVNIPIGVAVAVLALTHVPKTPGTGWRTGADVPGALLVTSGLMFAVYALVTVESQHWTRVSVAAAIALVLLTGFARRQAKAATPLLPRRLLRSRQVIAANLALALTVAGMFTYMFLSVLYMQRVLGWTPLWTGLAYLPPAVTVAVFSMAVTPRLLRRFSARDITIAGLGLLAAGFICLAAIPVAGTFLENLLPAFTLLGCGFGLAMPSLMNLGMSAAGPDDSGAASGLFTTLQQVGGAVGLAVLGTVATMAARQTTALSATEAAVWGYQVAFGAAAGLMVLAMATVAIMLRTSAVKPAAVSEPALDR